MRRGATNAAGLVLAVAGAALVPAVAGCRRHSAVPTQGPPSPLPAPTSGPQTGPASAPSAAPSSGPAVRTFESAAKKVRLAYPADWTVRPSQDYVLVAAPPGVEAGPAAGWSISLDVPDLPPHIPGLIPMGRVEKGYVDDLKGQWPGLRVDESTSQAVAGTQGRRVRSSWQAGGRGRIELALILVHADRVFILRADGDADRLSDLRQVFDAVAGSIQWVK